MTVEMEECKDQPEGVNGRSQQGSQRDDAMELGAELGGSPA